MAQTVESIKDGLQKVFSREYRSAETALAAQMARTDSDPDRKERICFWGDRIDFMERFAEQVKEATDLDVALRDPIPPETRCQEPQP